MTQRLKLGEIMLRAGAIDEMQLVSALAEQQKWGSRLGLVLVRLGFATEQEIVQAVASQLGVPVATLDGKKIPEEVLDLVPYDYADAHTCLPLFMKEEEGVETLYLATDDPSNLDVLDDLGFRTGLRVKAVVVATSEISSAIDRFYRKVDSGAESGEVGSSYFGTLTELVPTDADDGFDVFSFVGPTGKSAFELEDGGDVPLKSVGNEKAAGGALDASAQENVQPASNTNQVEDGSTRKILHALTQILIEKDLVSREEIFYRVKALAEREREEQKEES